MNDVFENLIIKFNSLYKQYANSFDELYQSIDFSECRKEYSKGGESMFWGYYSPSAADLYIGGLKRGKLLKDPSKNVTHSFEYLFDGNKMVCVLYCLPPEYNHQYGEIEFLVHSEDRILSFQYSYNFKFLKYITESIYKNGLLVQYTTVEFLDNKCSELKIEEFEYEDNMLKSVRYSCYLPSIKLLAADEKYIFTRDAEGYLDTYTVEDYIHPGSAMQNVQYKVLVKRK